MRLYGKPCVCSDRRIHFVTQQVDITPSQVIIRLFASAPVPQDRIGEAEKLLLRRTGKEVSLLVRKVASEEELALLRQQLKTPAPVAPPPQDLESIRADVVARLAAPVKEIWPAEAGELLAYEIGFTPEEVVGRIRYRSAKPLDATAQGILSNVLKTQLKVDKLRLDLEQEEPTPAPAKARGSRASPKIRK